MKLDICDSKNVKYIIISLLQHYKIKYVMKNLNLQSSWPRTKNQESGASITFRSKNKTKQQPSFKVSTRLKPRSHKHGGSPAVIASEVAFCRCEWSVFPPPGTTARPASARQNKHTHPPATAAAAIETNEWPPRLTGPLIWSQRQSPLLIKKKQTKRERPLKCLFCFVFFNNFGADSPTENYWWAAI